MAHQKPAMDNEFPGRNLIDPGAQFRGSRLYEVADWRVVANILLRSFPLYFCAGVTVAFFCCAQIDAKLLKLLAELEIECPPPQTTARLLDKLVSACTTLILSDAALRCHQGLLHNWGRRRIYVTRVFLSCKYVRCRRVEISFAIQKSCSLSCNTNFVGICEACYLTCFLIDPEANVYRTHPRYATAGGRLFGG